MVVRTGLKTKGDGIKWDCCSDIESCPTCQYFPFAPYAVPKADPVGLKACIFDNTADRLPPAAPGQPATNPNDWKGVSTGHLSTGTTGIKFRATRGNGWGGDIGVDNVLIRCGA